MPRARRMESETGIYHVVLRGINRQTIFQEEEDKEQFLVTMDRYRKESGYQLLAYCLMSNHIHLLIKTENETIGQIFIRIGASYVYWYNKKYDRTGHLFQGRFKSEVVETDEYLKAVLRYIHQNPINAGLVSTPEEFVWSSYREYLGLNDEQYVDKDAILFLFEEDKEKAVSEFQAFNEIESDDKCLDINDRKNITDKRAIQMIKKDFNLTSSTDIQNLEPLQKEQCIQFLINKGLPIRQISRITGISRYLLMKR